MKQLTSKDIVIAHAFLSSLKEFNEESLTNAEQEITLVGSGSQYLESCFEHNNTHTIAGKLDTLRKLHESFGLLTRLSTDIHARCKAEARLIDPTNYASFVDLSDDLIVMIHKLILNNGGSIEPLTQVSHSFYRRLSNIPELWTEVTPEKNPTLTLKRSFPCQLKLTVPVWANSWPVTGCTNAKRINDLLTFFTLVGSHATRWDSFSFREHFCEDEIFKLFASPSFPKVFPSLRSLDLSYYSAETPERDFICQWEMPALQSLTLRDYIPPGINASPEKLTLKLSFEEETFRNFKTLLNNSAPFTTLLNSISPHTLKELTVHLCFMGNTESLGGPPVLLPQLDTLTLDIACTYEEVVQSLLANFEAPNVRNLIVCVTSSHDMDGQIHEIGAGVVNALFPIDQIRWPKVTSLDLTIWTYDHLTLFTPMTRLPPLVEGLSINYKGLRDDDMDVGDGLGVMGQMPLREFEERYLPPIRDVQLRIHPLACDGDSVEFPPLRSLTLQSDNIDMSFLEMNFKILSSQDFEKLTVKGCRLLTHDEVRKRLPTDKLIHFEKAKR